MKTRNGFVSNSSSSSFIVGFPKLPSSPEDLEKMMFGHRGEVKPYDFCPETSTIDIAKRVFADINLPNTKRYNKRQLIKALIEDHHDFPGCPNYWNMDKESDKIKHAYKEETGKDIWDDDADPIAAKFWQKTKDIECLQMKREIAIAAKAFVEGFWPRVKGCTVFDLSYADDSGETNFEHGNIFRKLVHIKISHH
jgi:hypothetical protein